VVLLADGVEEVDLETAVWVFVDEIGHGGAAADRDAVFFLEDAAFAPREEHGIEAAVAIGDHGRNEVAAIADGDVEGTHLIAADGDEEIGAAELAQLERVTIIHLHWLQMGRSGVEREQEGDEREEEGAHGRE
jgi:hypothetical protein